MKRVPTGIEGLDKLIEGGFPENSISLICGTPGTGKSILSLQFLYNGAVKFNEKGVYISIEEKADALKLQAVRFGWDFDKLEKEGMVKFIKVPIDIANYDIIKTIKQEAETIGAKRVVIDAISILAINYPIYKVPIKTGYSQSEMAKSPYVNFSEQMRQFVYLFIDRIRGINSTFLITGDSVGHSGFLTRDTVSEFISDSVIELKMITMGKTVNRTLEIKKMRVTSIQPGLNTMNIDNNGISVLPFEY